jgi:hypothetical protein
MDKNRTQAGEDVSAHLSEVEDGCGCTEIWEHLSDEREEEEGE